jgi:hypothetical protein
VRNVFFSNLLVGFRFYGTQQFSVHDCRFEYNTYGVYHDVTLTVVAQQVSFRDCDFRNNTYGLYSLYSAVASKAYQWHFDTCHFEVNGTGMYVEDPIRWIFTNCKFEQNDNEAVYMIWPDHIVFDTCYFNNNSDVAVNRQVYFTSTTTDTFKTDIEFRQCEWANQPAGAPYDIYLEYASPVKITTSRLSKADGTSLYRNEYAEFLIYSHLSETDNPNPVFSIAKTLAFWCTYADLGSTYIGLLPVPMTPGTGRFYLADVKIHVTEAFSLASGSYVVLQVGNQAGSQAYTQSQDLTSTGIKSPVFNSNGYIEEINRGIRVTLVTDGALNAVGKALVVILYYEVPLEP